MSKKKLFVLFSLLAVLALVFSPVGGALAQGEPPQPQQGGRKIYLPITMGGNEGAVVPTATPPGPTATPPGITPTAIPTQPPTPPPPPPGSVQSDDFNYWPGVKSGVWGVQKPNDALVRTDGSHLRLYVPGGSEHHPWRNNANGSARAYQSLSGNQNFEVVAKFQSRPGTDSSFTAIQGILVEQDANNFLRFEFNNFNSNLTVYTGLIKGASQSQIGTTRTVSLSEVPGIDMALKLTRSGDNLTFAFSADGTNWIPLHTGSLGGLTVNKVGLYAGNSGTTTQSYEAAVDYFFNTAAPISPEDPIDPSYLFSDDFGGASLNPIWTLTRPVGSTPGVSFTGTQLRMDFPANVEHDIWDSVTKQLVATRLMQKTNNRNFEVEVKLDAMPQGTYVAQGLLVMEDTENFLQYYYYSYNFQGTEQLRLFASFVVDGVEQIPYTLDIGVPSGNVSAAPMWLRITREGTYWVLSYSGNGTSWTQAAAVHSSLVSNELGITIGTEDEGGNGLVPAFAGLVDYFQNTRMPLGSQD